MRMVVQRVTRASVTVDGEVTGKIGRGFMVLVGAEVGDTEADARLCADKLAGLRVFVDDEGKMNRSVLDVGGAILLVSQFTLLGDARGQNRRRPSFIAAARPEEAEPLLVTMKAMLEEKGLHVETGRFRAHMDVELVNDGPVTILIDSRKVF